MMSKKLSVNRIPTNLFWLTIKKNLGIIFLSLIFMLFVCPGYLAVILNSITELGAEDYVFNRAGYFFAEISGSVIVLTSGLAAVFCFINFAFLYSKKSVDLYFSLPLKRVSLFLARYLASIIPVIIISVLCFAAMGIVLFSADTTNVDWGFSQVGLSLMFNVAAILGISAMSCLFICCAGALPDLLISFIGLNIASVVISVILDEYCIAYLFGSGYIPSLDFEKINPFVYLLSRPFSFLEDYTLLNTKEILIYYCIALIILLISLSVSLILFKKRKAEKCSCAYAFKGMYYICSVTAGFICVYLMGALFSSGDYGPLFWVFGLFGALIGCSTYGLVSDRSFKNIKKSLLLGTIAFVLSGVVVVILATGGFGYSRFIPQKQDISKACIDGENELLIEDISITRNFHKNTIDKQPHFKELILKNKTDNQTDTFYYRINYTLKNGKEINRDYQIKRQDIKNEIAQIYKSDYFVNKLRDEVNNININEEIFISYAFNGKKEEIDDSMVDVVKLENVEKKITHSQIKDLIDAYIKDIKQLPPEVIAGSEPTYYISIHTKNYEIRLNSIYFNESYENLIEQLNILIEAN